MITRIHHVGVVVRELADGFAFWRDVLALPVVREAEIPDQGVRAALLAAGRCEVELLQPIDPEGSVARFLTRRGEALHHLCFESDDVRRDVSRLRATAVDMIDTRPRRGLAGMVAFVHPRACGGILVELATPVEHATPPATPVTLTTVHAVVEDVAAAATLYGDLFNLHRGLTDPTGLVAQLEVGGTTLHLSAMGTAGGRPGLSGLRAEVADLTGLAERLEAHRIAFRRGGFGLILGANATHGATLIVQERTAREAGT